jgi:hypothetical protein
MNIEFNLMELNSLYVAVSNQLKQAKKDAKDYPSDFFQSELTRIEELNEKVQDALWAECKVVDDAIAEVRKSFTDTKQSELNKLEDLYMELGVLEDERNYYASLGDWDRCEFINDRIAEVKEEVNQLK